MFDGLSISISGSGASARNAVRGVRESLQEARSAAVSMAGGMEVAGESMDDTASDAAGLSLALRGVSSSADEAGDELVEASTRAGVASGAFGTLSAASASSSLSFKGLSTTTSLALIPSLLTLSTMLAPLAAGFAVVAGGAASLLVAFGSLIGAGILAWGEQLASQMEGVSDPMEALGKVAKQLQKRLADAIAPLGESFIPLLQDATRMLPVVVDEMVQAVGSTEEFRRALRGFGMLAARVLPALTGFVFDFARTAMPHFRQFVDFMMGNGSTAFNDIMASVRELRPEFMALLGAVVEMLPVLLRFGTNVADLVIPALTWLVDVGTDVMRFINGLSPALRSVVLAATILAPAITAVVGTLSGLSLLLTGQGLIALIGGSGGLGAALAALTGPIGLVVAGVGILAAAWATNLWNMREMTEDTVDDIKKKLSTLAKDPAGTLVDSFKDAADVYQEGGKIDRMLGNAKTPGNKGSGASTPGKNPYLKQLKNLRNKDFASSWAMPQKFKTAGKTAGQSFTTGFKQGLSTAGLGAMKARVIKDQQELASLRTQFKAAQTIQRRKELLNKIQAIRNHPRINNRLSDSDRVTRMNRGASNAPKTRSRSVTGLGVPRTGGSSPTSGGWTSGLKVPVQKFESAVDKFARAVENQTVVVEVKDSEFAQVIDARYEQHSHQTATRAENYGHLTQR